MELSKPDQGGTDWQNKTGGDWVDYSRLARPVHPLPGSVGWPMLGQGHTPSPETPPAVPTTYYDPREAALAGGNPWSNVERTGGTVPAGMGNTADVTISSWSPWSSMSSSENTMPAYLDPFKQWADQQRQQGGNTPTQKADLGGK